MPTGRTFVAVDTLGAGLDEMVLICQGSSARLTPETEKLPVDAVVIGLVDTVDIGGHDVLPVLLRLHRLPRLNLDRHLIENRCQMPHFITRIHRHAMRVIPAADLRRSALERAQG